MEEARADRRRRSRRVVADDRGDLLETPRQLDPHPVEVRAPVRADRGVVVDLAEQDVAGRADLELHAGGLHRVGLDGVHRVEGRLLGREVGVERVVGQDEVGEPADGEDVAVLADEDGAQRLVHVDGHEVARRERGVEVAAEPARRRRRRGVRAEPDVLGAEVREALVRVTDAGHHRHTAVPVQGLQRRHRGMERQPGAFDGIGVDLGGEQVRDRHAERRARGVVERPLRHRAGVVDRDQRVEPVVATLELDDDHDGIGGRGGLGGRGPEHRAQERVGRGDGRGGHRAALQELASSESHATSAPQWMWNSGSSSMSAIAPRTLRSITVVSVKLVAPPK